MEYKIDAANKILGRLATEVSLLLRGKNEPTFEPNKLGNNKIFVYNTDKLRVTGKKISQKLYRRHSGFHGGLKEEALRSVMERDSRIALKHAIMGMLPKNKLRDRVMKNLVLIKGEV